MIARAFLAAAASAALAGSAAAPAAAEPFATTPGDDRPEGVLIDGDTVFVSTTTGAPELATGGGDPSTIHLFDRTTGARKDVIELSGERTSGPFAVEGVQGAAGMAMDASRRLYVADGQGRVLRFTRQGRDWRQDTYATIADLKPCAVAPPPCSAGADDRLPLVNEIDFAPDGTLFVTDSFQATVWRVPPGGGAARVHLTDERLSGVLVGPNGIVSAPDGESLYLAVMNAAPGASALYRLGIDSPTLHLLSEIPLSGLDGLALAASGRVYAAFNSSGEVGVLSPDGTLERRIAVENAQEPAGIAFDPGTASVLVANHSYGAIDDAPRVISRVHVGEEGAPRVRPPLPRGHG